MNILVGCDPEIFVRKNGVFHSAHGLISGDKKNPFIVPNGAVQVDGMALEFNINPAHSQDEFYMNISSVMETLRKMVPDYEMVAVPVADFDEATIKAQPAEALELGCEPDYNGWEFRENQRPNGDVAFRTASGHVHIGWTNDKDIQDAGYFNLCAAVVRQLDFYLGLPSLVYDGDTRRRSLYGKAGAFRPKSYGVEYRVLSNRWLASKELIDWVYQNTVKGLHEFFKNDNRLFERYDVQEIINTSNVNEAMKIIKQENIPCPVM